MKDSLKHSIASFIYRLIIGIKREVTKIWKLILLGICIFIVFVILAEWSDVLFGSNQKELFCTIGLILGLIPLVRFYYLRIKDWILKYK
jgi:VanZ family protein